VRTPIWVDPYLFFTLFLYAIGHCFLLLFWGSQSGVGSSTTVFLPHLYLLYQSESLSSIQMLFPCLMEVKDALPFSHSCWPYRLADPAYPTFLPPVFLVSSIKCKIQLYSLSVLELRSSLLPYGGGRPDVPSAHPVKPIHIVFLLFSFPVIRFKIISSPHTKERRNILNCSLLFIPVYSLISTEFWCSFLIECSSLFLFLFGANPINLEPYLYIRSLPPLFSELSSG